MSNSANRPQAATAAASQSPSISLLVAEESGEYSTSTPVKQGRSTRTPFQRQQSTAESEASAPGTSGGIGRGSVMPLAHCESESGEDRTFEDNRTWNQGSFGSTLSANTTTGSLLQPPTPCSTSMYHHNQHTANNTNNNSIRPHIHSHHHVAEEDDDGGSIADEMLDVVGAVVASDDTHSAPYSPTQQRMPALSPTKVSPWSTPAHRTTTARGGAGSGNYHHMIAQSWGSADLSAFDTISHPTPKGTPHRSPAAISTTSGPLHNVRSRGSLCGDEWRGISPTNPSPYTMEEMSSSVHTSMPFSVGTTPTTTTGITGRRESDVIPSSMMPPTVVMLGSELEDATANNDGFVTPESSGVDSHHNHNHQGTTATTSTATTGLKLWTSPTDDFKHDRRSSCGSVNTIQPTTSIRKVVALRTITPASQGSSLNQSRSRSYVNGSHSSATPVDTSMTSGMVPATSSGGLSQNTTPTATTSDGKRMSHQQVKHVISGEDLCALIPEGVLSPNRRKGSAHYTSILLGKPIISDPADERAEEEPSPIALAGATPPRTPVCGARSIVLSDSSPPVSSMSFPTVNKGRGDSAGGGGSEGALSPSQNNTGGSRGFTTTSTTNSRLPYHTTTTMMTLMQGGYKSMKHRSGSGSMTLTTQHLSAGYGAAESGEYLDSLAVSPCTPTYGPDTPYGVNTASTDQCVGFGSRRSSGTWSRGPTTTVGRQAGEMGSIACSIGSLGDNDTPHMWGPNRGRHGRFSPHVREESKAHEEIHTHSHQYEHRSSIDAFTGMLSSPISMSSGRTDQPHYTGSTDCFSPISMGGGGMSPTTSGPPTVCRMPSGSRFAKSPLEDFPSPQQHTHALPPPVIAPIPLGAKSARGQSPTTTTITVSGGESPMRSTLRAEGVPRPIESDTMRASEEPITTLPPLPASPSKLGLGDRSPARGPHRGVSSAIPPLLLSPSRRGSGTIGGGGTILFGGNDSLEDDCDAVLKFACKSARRQSQCSDSSEQFALANTVTSDRGGGGGMPPLPLSPPTKYQQSHYNDHSFNSNQHLYSPPACKPQWPIGGDESGHGVRSGSHSRTQSNQNLRTSSVQRGGGSYPRNPVPEEQPNRNPFSTLRPQLTSPSISTPRTSVLSPGRAVHTHSTTHHQQQSSRPTTGPGGKMMSAIHRTTSITSAVTGECSPRSPCTSPSSRSHSHSHHHPSSMGFVFPYAQNVSHTPICRSGLSSPRSQSAPFQIPHSTAHMVLGLGGNHFAPLAAQSSVQNSSFTSTSAVNSHNISVAGPLGHHHQAPSSTTSGIGGGGAMPPLYPNSHGSSNTVGGGALPHSQWGSLSSGMVLGGHHAVNLSGTGGGFASVVSELASASSSYSGGAKPHVYAIPDHHHSSSSHSHPAHNDHHIQRSSHLSFSAADDSPRDNRTSVMSEYSPSSASLHPSRGHPLAQLATPASSAHAAIVLYEQWIPPMVAVAEAQKHPSACASRTHSRSQSRLHLSANNHNNSSQHLRHSVCSSGDGGSIPYIPRRSGGGSRLTPHTDSLSPAVSPHSNRKAPNLDFGVQSGAMHSADDSFSLSTGRRRKSIASFSSFTEQPSQLPGIGAHQLVSILPGNYPSGSGSGVGVVASGANVFGARKLSLQQYQAIQSTVAKGPPPHGHHCAGSESDTPTPIASRVAPSGTQSVEEGTLESVYRSNVSAQLFGSSDDCLDGRGGAGGGNHHDRGLSFESAKMQASWEAEDHQLHQHQQQQQHHQQRNSHERLPFGNDAFRNDAEDVEDAMDQACSTAAGSPLAGAGGLVGFESSHRHRNPQLSTSIRSTSLNMPSATYAAEGNTSLNTSSCFATTMGRSEMCGSLGQSLRRGVVLPNMAEVSSPLGCTSPLTRNPQHQQHLWASSSRDPCPPPSMPTTGTNDDEDRGNSPSSSPWSPNPNHSPIEREATDDRSPLTPINTTPSPLQSTNTGSKHHLSTTGSGRATDKRTPPPTDFSGKSLMGHYDSDPHPHSTGMTQSDSDNTTIHQHHTHHTDPTATSSIMINVAGYEDRSFGSPQQVNPPSTGAHRVSTATSRLHNAESDSNTSSATFTYNRTNSNSCCIAVPLARPLESGGLKSVATAPHLDEHLEDSDDASSYCSSSIIDDELDNNNNNNSNTESSEEIEDVRTTKADASSPPQFAATSRFQHNSVLSGRSGLFGGSGSYSGSPLMMGHRKSFLGGGGGGEPSSIGRLVDKFKARLQLSHFVPWLQRWAPIPVHGDVNGTIWVGNSLIDGLPNLVKEVPCVPHIHRNYEKISGGNFNTPDKEMAGFSCSSAAADFSTPSRHAGLPGPSGSLGDGTHPSDFCSPVSNLNTNFTDVLRAECNTTPLCPTSTGINPFATVNATPTRHTPTCGNPVCTPSGTPSGRAVSTPNSHRISREAAMLQCSLQGRAITPPTVAYPISATEKIVPLQLRLELVMLSLAGQHATNGTVRVPVYNITSDALPENIYAANTDLCASAIVSPALRSSIPAYLTSIEHTKKVPLSLCKDADQYFVRLQSVYRSVKSGNFILSTEYPLAPLHEVFLPSKLSTGKEHRFTTRLVRTLKDAAEGHTAPLETLMYAYLQPFKVVPVSTASSSASASSYSGSTLLVPTTLVHLAQCVSYSIDTLHKDTSAYCDHIVKGNLPQGGPSSFARLVSDTFGALRTVHACDYLHGCPTTHSIFTKGTPPTGDSSDLTGLRFKLGNFGSVVPNPGSYSFPLECSNHTPNCVAHRSFTQLFPHVPSLYIPQLDVMPTSDDNVLSTAALYPAVERFIASMSLMHLVCRRFASSVLPSAALLTIPVPHNNTSHDEEDGDDDSDILSPNFSPIPQSCGQFPKGVAVRTRKGPGQSLRVALHTLLTLLPSAASDSPHNNTNDDDDESATANKIHQFQRSLVSVFVSICGACPDVVCPKTSARLLNEVATFLGQDIRVKSSSSAAESVDLGNSSTLSSTAKKGHNAPLMQSYHDELVTCLQEQESTVDEKLRQLLLHAQELRGALATRSPPSRAGDATSPQHHQVHRRDDEEHDDSSNSNSHSSHCDVVMPSDTSFSSCTALGNGLLSSMVSPTTHPVYPHDGYSHKSSNLFSPSTMPLPVRNNTFSDIPASIIGGMTPPTTRTTSSLADGESPNSHYQRHLNNASSTSGGGVVGAGKALNFSPSKNSATPEGTSAAVSNTPSYQRPNNHPQAARQLLTNTSSGSSTSGTPWSLRQQSSSTSTTPRQQQQQNRASPQAASQSPITFASPSRLPLRGGSGLRTASRMMDEAMTSADNQLFKETISAANEMISRTVESGHASMFPHRYDLLSQMMVGAAGRNDGIAKRIDKALQTKPEQRPRQQ